MDLIWDLYLMRQIGEVGTTANQASQKATDQQFRVRQLEQSVDKLVLINMAMWNLLKTKAGLTEADLLVEMQRIDLVDGAADGRVTPSTHQCNKCGRTISTRHKRCLYCGQSTGGDAFASVR